MNVAKLGDTIIKTGICNYGIKQYCLFLNVGNICAGAGYYEHLSDAIHAAESSAGFERWIN